MLFFRANEFMHQCHIKSGAEQMERGARTIGESTTPPSSDSSRSTDNHKTLKINRGVAGEEY